MIRRAHAHGRDVIPVVPFADIASGAVDPHAVTAIRTHGAVVIRGVFDPQQARDWNDEIGASGREPLHRPAARACRGPLFRQPRVGQAADLRRLLVEAAGGCAPVAGPDPGARVPEPAVAAHADGGRTHFDPDKVPAYADRIRRRPPGSTSLGLSPHVDGGSVERWLGANFRRVYRHVLAGRWRDYDPFDAAFRPDVEEIPSPAVCSMFRTFQGWTALTPQGLAAALQLIPVANAMAYVVLRALQDDVADDDLCGARPGRALSIRPNGTRCCSTRWCRSRTWSRAMRCSGTSTSCTRSRCAPRQRRQHVHRRRAGCAKNDAYLQRQRAAFLRGEARFPGRSFRGRIRRTGWGAISRRSAVRRWGSGRARSKRAARESDGSPGGERRAAESAACRAKFDAIGCRRSQIDANCAIWLPIMVRTQRSRPCEAWVRR